MRLELETHGRRKDLPDNILRIVVYDEWAIIEISTEHGPDLNVWMHPNYILDVPRIKSL